MKPKLQLLKQQMHHTANSSLFLSLQALQEALHEAFYGR